MRNDPEQYELAELIQKELDGSLTDNEFARLESFLKQDPRYRDYYVKTILAISAFYDSPCQPLDVDHTADSFSSSMLWALLADDEQKAPAVIIDKTQTPCDFPADMASLPNARRTNRSSFYSALLLIAALILMIVFVQVDWENLETVATVKNCSNVQFADKTQAGIGSRMTNRKEVYWLEKGLLEISFDYGAVVMVEGPAIFRLESPEKIRLESGRIFASIPGSAKGFTVNTPNMTIIDLGTEFGVQVEIDGTGSVHMIKGRASLIPGPKGKTGDFQMLTEGQAGRVDRSGTIHEIPFWNDHFVRQLDARTGTAWKGQNISLADMVGGGNGFGTGRQDYGIMIETATPSNGPLFITGHGIKHEKTWDTFCPVTQIPGIDGIFTPDGGQGPAIVSSQGHLFSDCPDTSSSWSGPIVNGARVLEGDFELVVNNIAYGTPKNPALFLHANIGITYDLNAIRQTLPTQQALTRFVSSVRTPKNLRDSLLDIWILVDGKVRFSKVNVAQLEFFSIDIPLTEQDRFLSLAVTDGLGDKPDQHKNVFDWCFFCQPELVIESK